MPRVRHREPAGKSMSKSSKQPTRVLFIGNSFTARNDLPELIAQLAAARGVEMDYELLNIGGASLRTHWNKGPRGARFRRGNSMTSFCRNRARCRSRTPRACARMSCCSTKKSARPAPGRSCIRPGPESTPLPLAASPTKDRLNRGNAASPRSLFGEAASGVLRDAFQTRSGL